MSDIETVYTKMRLGVRLGFETYAPTILGTSFENCTPVALLDYVTATALGYDVKARHTNVYPMLPAGVAADDYRTYSYYRIQLQNGSYDIVGAPWIKPGTITEKGYGVLEIKVVNATENDIPIVRQALAAQGLVIGSIGLK